MSDCRYNGWTNFETWCANLWLTNDGSELLDEWAQECLNDAEGDRDEAVIALSDMLESYHDDIQDETVKASGLFADLLNAAMRCIDWREIAENALSDIEYDGGDV